MPSRLAVIQFDNCRRRVDMHESNILQKQILKVHRVVSNVRSKPSDDGGPLLHRVVDDVLRSVDIQPERVKVVETHQDKRGQSAYIYGQKDNCGDEGGIEF